MLPRVLSMSSTVGKLGFSIIVRITADGYERPADQFFAVAAV